MKIKSFEEACAALGISPALPDFSAMPEKHQKSLTAHCKLVIIAEALNEGWQPDWSDSSQWKYYPWFYVEASKQSPSGLGLSYDGYGSSATRTAVGSRLAYKSAAVAKYAGDKFKDLYTDYFLLT